MRLRGAEKIKLETSISKNFTSYVFDANAPQGKNNFSCNYLLKKETQQFLLKILLKKKIKGAVNKAQALAEVEIAKTINSHYVLSPINIKDNDDYIFILFPFLEGENLKEYIEDKTFDEKEILKIGISLLRGIIDFWREEIVHQDLKPENIFVETNGSIKILDFGSARFRTSPFRGASRRNFAWSSPEQILASRPINIESLRRTLDDRSDVYVVGLILYCLIEGKHPFKDFDVPSEAIFAGETIPSFTRTDISSELKKAVMRMLSIHQLDRPNAQAAIDYLVTKNVSTPKLQNGGFYYCITNGTSRFLEMKKNIPGMFDGVIVEASQIPIDAKKRIEIGRDIKTILVDPQFYLFQSPPHRSKKFTKLPYFKYEHLFQDMPGLLDKIKRGDPEVISLIEDITNYQLNVGATALIPPFLYIDEFNNDTWSIDQEITRLAFANLKKYNSVKPFVKGVAISQEILTSDISRNRILEYLTSLSEKVEGYMVLLDSAHSQVITNESWLKGAQDLFIKLLSTGKYVIWNKADLASLIMAPTGISIATGEALTQRRFNIVKEKQSGGRHVPYFYIPSLFARSTWPDALKGFAQYKDLNKLLCSKNCCSSVNFSTPIKRASVDLAKHMMYTISCQFKKYGISMGKKTLIEDIKKAQQHYGLLKNHRSLIVKESFKKNIKPSSESFLNSWTNTLNG